MMILVTENIDWMEERYFKQTFWILVQTFRWYKHPSPQQQKSDFNSFSLKRFQDTPCTGLLMIIIFQLKITLHKMMFKSPILP